MASILSIVVPLVIALLGSGAALYTARSQKDSILSAASKNIAEASDLLMGRLKAENEELHARVETVERDLREARGRIRQLEDEVVSLGGGIENLKEREEPEDV